MISGQLQLKSDEFNDYYEVCGFSTFALKTKTDIYELIRINSLIEEGKYGKPVALLVAKDIFFDDLEKQGLSVLTVLDNGKIGYPYGFNTLHWRATYFEEVLSKEVQEAVNHSNYTQNQEERVFNYDEN